MYAGVEIYVRGVKWLTQPRIFPFRVSSLSQHQTRGATRIAGSRSEGPHMIQVPRSEAPTYSHSCQVCLSITLTTRRDNLLAHGVLFPQDSGYRAAKSRRQNESNRLTSGRRTMMRQEDCIRHLTGVGRRWRSAGHPGRLIAIPGAEDKDQSQPASNYYNSSNKTKAFAVESTLDSGFSVLPGSRSLFDEILTDIPSRSQANKTCKHDDRCDDEQIVIIGSLQQKSVQCLPPYGYDNGPVSSSMNFLERRPTLHGSSNPAPEPGELNDDRTLSDDDRAAGEEDVVGGLNAHVNSCSYHAKLGTHQGPLRRLTNSRGHSKNCRATTSLKNQHDLEGLYEHDQTISASSCSAT
ncbi:uncharacterized protein MYCFIDRAFT_180087 [Pseudocercospora fijiensis CIRAD86]|uniref:Uncharacterized protein n=1 Tax=Pseudocercospora fijiensis (strain CIRAD86) TaxID=383855 RepID=M2ZDP2_PSEFD|nr:uncharacterized protein MYCFIDRAFT_180087 [Pseudocercospora fijiensis CIRAD86]EME77214.1 hypothetical protein MYCFIDRAFT_180087 [Pseudocercospora fijiensis CIRAD86]